MAREPISKKTRFDVFKRDAFTCQYCGQTPPSVTLEVDHIEPVCEGGSNDKDNLITACFGCNRGKGGERLSSVPQTVAQKAEAVKEAEAQLKAYRRTLATKRRREDADIDAIEEMFSRAFKGYLFTEKFREDIRRSFLPYLDIGELLDAMRMTTERVQDQHRATKYFCGVCWTKRRNNGSV